MPTESHSDPIAPASLETTSVPVRTPPSWFAQLIAIARCFQQRGVLSEINDALFLQRRVDATAAIDPVFVMLAALLGHCSLSAATHSLDEMSDALPALWNRKALPSRSAISRFLSALTKDALDAMQSLFCVIFANTACAIRAALA